MYISFRMHFGSSDGVASMTTRVDAVAPHSIAFGVHTAACSRTRLRSLLLATNDCSDCSFSADGQFVANVVEFDSCVRVR